MEIVKLNKRRPSVEEASRRLENLYADLTERGADETFLGILMFSFAASKIIESEDTLVNACSKMNEVQGEILQNHKDDPLSWD